MATDQEIYDAVVAKCKEYVPKLRIISKQKSAMHRAIGKLLKYFGNPNYLNDYFTTIGFTVGYPGDKLEPAYYNTYWHEAGHAYQAKTWTRLIFGALYLLGTPVYLLPALLFSWPFFVWLPWWSGLIVAGAFLLLCCPVPFGMWRARWELQMYGLSIALRYWTGRDVSDAYIDGRVKEFTTGAYFWMCPFGGYVKRKLNGYLKEAKTGAIFHRKKYGKYYADAYKTLRPFGVITKPALKDPT